MRMTNKKNVKDFIFSFFLDMLDEISENNSDEKSKVLPFYVILAS